MELYWGLGYLWFRLWISEGFWDWVEQWEWAPVVLFPGSPVLAALQMPWENEAGVCVGIITPVCSCSSLYHAPLETSHGLRVVISSKKLRVWVFGWKYCCLARVSSDSRAERQLRAVADNGLNCWNFSCLFFLTTHIILWEKASAILQNGSLAFLISSSTASVDVNADVASFQRGILTFH